MQSAFRHFVLLCVACVLTWLGYLISSYPEKTSRIFTFGQQPNRYSITFFRIVGRVFLVMFALGTLMYLVLIPLDLLGTSFGH
jgi:hypothetical protein